MKNIDEILSSLPNILPLNNVFIFTTSYSKCKSCLDLHLFWAILTEEERRTAKKFVQTIHQENFIIARGMLRFLLAKYLNCLPQNICFTSNDYGKLFIAHPSSNLYFNVSHSNDKIVYALSLNKNLGIDIEYIRDNVEECNIAQKFFHKNEYAFIKQLNDCNQQLAKMAFFHCWTRKEAFIKAIGLGLSHSLKEFEVELNDLETLTNTDNQNIKASHVFLHTLQFSNRNWSLIKLNINANYTSALVIENYDNDKILIQTIV